MPGTTSAHIPAIEPSDRDDGLTPVIDEISRHSLITSPNPEDVDYVRAALELDALLDSVHASIDRMNDYYAAGHFVRARNSARKAFTELVKAAATVDTLQRAFDTAAHRSPKGAIQRRASVSLRSDTQEVAA